MIPAMCAHVVLFSDKSERNCVLQSLTKISGAPFCMATSLDSKYNGQYFDEHVERFVRVTPDAQLMDRPAAIAGNETPVEEILEENSPEKGKKEGNTAT